MIDYLVKESSYFVNFKHNKYHWILLHYDQKKRKLNTLRQHEFSMSKVREVEQTASEESGDTQFIFRACFLRSYLSSFASHLVEP